MKFCVNRTNVNYREKPCEEAKREPNSNSNYNWTIEINSLEDLFDFIKKNGRIIMEENKGYVITITPPPPKWSIEIYDGYRE